MPLEPANGFRRITETPDDELAVPDINQVVVVKEAGEMEILSGFEHAFTAQVVTPGHGGEGALQAPQPFPAAEQGCAEKEGEEY